MEEIRTLVTYDIYLNITTHFIYRVYHRKCDFLRNDTKYYEGVVAKKSYISILGFRALRRTV